MISADLFEVVRCPECGGRVSAASDGARCDGCGRPYATSDGYLDLRPREAFAEQTKYLDEALHVDARHVSVSPPLLGSKVRFDRLRRFLALAPGDRAVDLGCGSGRSLVWAAPSGASLTGIDISPHFAREAIDRCDLLLGDLRRLPLRDDAFTKAWSLDVLEHLSRDALLGMLGEANRVLAPGGTLFVYTHVRTNGPLGGAVRLVNRLAARLERRGWIDLRQERLRKSDHLNPLVDHDDLSRVMDACGFRLERVTYYTPIIGAFVENILARLGERWLVGRARRPSGSGTTATASNDAVDTSAVRAARADAKARIDRRGPTYLALRLASAVMTLDVWLFGRVRSGPFFALARKIGPPSPPV